MKNILIKNSLFSVLQAVINIILIFITIPIFIKLLGSELYGIFALIMVIGNLNTFTSLGLTSALVKFIAEQGRTEESNIDIWVNLIIMVGITFPLTLMVIYFDKFILLNILKIPLKYYAESRWLYYWVLWANFFLLIGQTFKSVLDAMQKVYITSLQQIIYNLFYWSFILITLLIGFGLPEIGFCIFISALTWLIITIISTIKVWGSLSLVGFQSNFKKAAKKQLNYGLKIYSGGLISFLFEPLSKILLSNFIGISAVGYYDIAMKLKGQLWGIISKIFYPLFPFISEQKDKTIIRKYVHDLEQKTSLIVVPIIVLSILLMNPFITIWIKTNIEIISITSIYLISFHLIGSTVIPNYQFLMAKNLAQKTINIQIVGAVSNALFFLISVNYLGYYALIIGNIAGIMSSFILSLYYQKKYLNSLIFDSFSQFLRLCFAFTIIFTSGYIIKYFIGNSPVLSILSISITVMFSTLLTYKVLHLIRQNDIHRYFGTHNYLSLTLCKFF